MAEEEIKDVDKPRVTELSQAATANRMGDIADEVRRVAGKDQISAEDETYLDGLRDEFDELDEHRKKAERRALVSRVDAATNRPLTTERSHSPRELDDDPFGEPDSIRDQTTFRNPYDESEMRTWGKSSDEIGSELRSRAFSAIEKMQGTNDHTRQIMTGIIEKFDNSRGDIAKLALRTSNPDYIRAFNKASRGLSEGSFTPKERQAVEAMRAMSLTDSAGGYLIPLQVDPTVIISSAGTVNTIRGAARQVVATGDVWNGVSAGATSWSWDAENAESSSDESTFSQPTVPIYKGVGFVPISEEALQDEANVTGEVGRLLAFGKDTLEATALATGAGSTEPTGITTALVGLDIKTATIGTFAIADVYSTDSTLESRWAANASWLMHRAVLHEVRKFDTAGGAGLLARIGEGAPTQLLGRPVYEAEAMDSAITAGNDIAVYGDFDQYVIADRLGVQVSFIPHLFHVTTNLPSGQSGWRATFRMGADSIVDTAFEMLQVRTA